MFAEDLDDAARDGQKSVVSRAAAAVGAGVVLFANFGIVKAAVWVASALLLEGYLHVSTRSQARGQAGSPVDRLNFVIGSTLLTVLWSGSAAAYWFYGNHGLQIVAMMVLTGQLIDAQAFAYRSSVILAANSAVPAVMLLVLPLFFGGLSGVALISTLLAVLLMLGYVAASARANMQSAHALRMAFAQAQDIAHSDPLTGLANRRMFETDIGRAMAFWERRRIRFALLMIDMDKLKLVNDTLGHDAGDAMLIEAANRLRGLIRRTDSLARIGGDEFAILLADVGDVVDVESFCRRVVDAFVPEMRFRGQVLNSTPSIGAAIFPGHGDDQAAIYKAADLALYAAKENGRNTWRIYDPSLTSPNGS